MAKQSINLQDSFLNQVRKDNQEIQLVLLDGGTLKGLVKGFDNFTVVLNSDSAQHLVYKHAIAHIVTTKPLRDNFSLGGGGRREDHPREDHPRGDHPRGERRPRSEDGARADRGARGRDSQPRHEKSGAPRGDKQASGGNRFNTMDLSSVKLGEGEQPTPPESQDPAPAE